MGFINQLITGGHHPVRLHCSLMFESFEAPRNHFSGPRHPRSVRLPNRPLPGQWPAVARGHGIHGTAWHWRRYGTDGSGDAWRTRTWSLCLCGLLRAFLVAPKMASSATKIGFQLLLCEKGLPAVQSRVQDGGFFFADQIRKTVFAKFWQLKTHPLKNL